MTKLEELARKIANDADLLGSAGSSRIQAQLETALKPLLDAFQIACDLANTNQEHWDTADYTMLRESGEQLFQWRPEGHERGVRSAD